MLDGYVVPFGKDGDPLPDLKMTQEVSGTCDRAGEAGPYPLSLPDGYPERCWWRGSGSQSCFKRPGRLEIGDVVFCPEAFWHEAYDPMQFVKVKVAAFT